MSIRIHKRASLLAAAAAGILLPLGADGAVYDFAYTTNDAWNNNKSWKVNSSWVKQGGGTGYPNAAGDIAIVTATVTGNKELSPGANTSVTVGQLIMNVGMPGWADVKVLSYNNPTTIHFNNSGSEAALEIRKGTVRFGGNTSDVVTINMVDDLLITNGTASSATLLFHSGDAKLTGSSDLTIRAGGTGNLNVSLGGTLHTFTGAINVDGATSILSVGTSAALGNASNAITLLNDGRFVGTNESAFSLQRTITGKGSITAATSSAGTTMVNLVVDTDGVLSPGVNSVDTLDVLATELSFINDAALNIDLSADGVSDLIDVTGSVALGGSLNLSTLGDYTPAVGHSWTVLTASDGISGNFGSPLPAGFVASIEGNDLVVSYVPEPASLAGVAVGAMLLLPRMRRR